MIRTLQITTKGKGLYEITDEVHSIVHQSQIEEGLATVFIQHTSASLTIQENADPSARYDLEKWMDAHVPFDRNFTHTSEGKDDMPSHIKSVLTNVSISIPIQDGRLLLGTWQGIYLWEHRDAPHKRKVIVSIV